MTTVKLRTINVNGLNDSIKRRAVFDKLREDGCDVTFLQETHSTGNILKVWKAQWPGRSYWAHGLSSSCGVAILFKRDLDVQITEVTYGSDGRYIMVKCKIQDQNLYFINVYAPVSADATSQLDFILSLEKICLSIGEGNSILLAGDFNCTINPEMDRKDFDVNNGVIPSKEYWKRLLQLADDYSLSDIWRVKNTDALKFTFHRGIQASRLDWWYLSDELTNQVTQATIIPWVLSDHSFVDIELSIIKFERGPGIWKLNVALLKDNNYIDVISDLLQSIEVEPDVPDCPADKWEYIKYKVRQVTKQYAKKKAKERRLFIADLEAEILALTSLSDIGVDVVTELDTNKRVLKSVLEEKARAAAFRARAKWSEKGEKCSKYFLNLEKSKAKNKVVSCIKDDEGNTFVTQDEIAKEQVRFYKKLYTPIERVEPNEWLQENDVTLPQLDDKMATDMEKPILLKELADALKSMANSKTPGTDGLPAEFYKVFWKDIKHNLFRCITWVLDNGILTQEQSRGAICLIPKKEKDKARLENWRPITLLNVDYKILTKALAKRLIVGIHEIIHPDQTGYIPKRSIGENIRTVNDIIDFCNHTNIAGVLVGVDFYKAFDTLAWDSIFVALRGFGFHDQFISWIKTLFKNPSTTILNAGWTSEYFFPKRGIRQGCPISGYLFILVLEVMAIRIRQSEEIKGIIVGGQEFKLSAYADDITGFARSVNDAKAFISVTQGFQRFSGLRINMRKSEVLPLGTTRQRECTLLNVKVVQRIRILGVCLRSVNTPSGLYYDNFQPCIEKMKTIVSSWINRDLSLKGKVTVINTLIVSLLGFLTTNIFTPPRVVSEVKALVVNYLWSYKKSKVAYTTMIQKVKRGGLNLCDVQARIKASNVAWVKRYVIKRGECHSTVFLKAICGWQGDIFVHLKTRAKKVIMPNETFHFYKILIRDWLDVYNWKIPDEGLFDEYIWCNKFWRISKLFDDSKVSKWKRAGIMKLRHIVQNNVMMSFEQINAKYDVQCTFIDMLALRAALPENVKNHIHSVNPPEAHQDILYIPNVDMEGTELDEATAATVYEFIVVRQGKQYKAVQRWYDTNVDYFEGVREVDWPMIFTSPYLHVRETKLQTLQFKIIHRILPCNKLLKIYRIKDSDECEYCGKKDDIAHFFINCAASQMLWKRIWRWLEFQVKCRHIILSEPEILLGVHGEYHKNLRYIINVICLFTKFYIYRQRLYHQADCNFEVWCKEFKRRLDTEKYILEKNQKSDDFKRWETLYETM